MVDLVNGLASLVSTATNPSAIIVAAIIAFLLWFVYSKEKRSEDRAVKFDEFLKKTTEQQAITGRILEDLVKAVSELVETYRKNCNDFQSSHREIHKRLDQIEACGKEVENRIDELDDTLSEVKTEIRVRNS